MQRFDVEKWDEPIEIMERDGKKSVSIELSDNYDGEFDENGVWHFSRMEFFGVCCLGKFVNPAMKSASVELYSQNELLKDINSKIKMFKKIKLDNNINNKGGEIQNNKINNFSVLELDDKSIEKLSNSICDKLLSVKDKKGGRNMPKGKDFSLTGEQLVKELSNILGEVRFENSWGFEQRRYYYIDHKPDENLVIVEDGADNWNLYGFSYSIDKDKVTIDFESGKRMVYDFREFEGDDEPEIEFTLVSKQRYEEAIEHAKAEKEKELIEKFSTEKETAINESVEQEKEKIRKEYESKLNEESSKLSDLQTKYSILMEEVEELKNYKQEKETAERKEQIDAIFEMFSEKLTEEEMKPVREFAEDSEVSINEIENKLKLIAFDKVVKFSKNTKKESKVVKFNFDDKEGVKPSRYGDLFEKYGFKNGGK